jgi:N-succinyldiaminopimelate aminotransferase
MTKPGNAIFSSLGTTIFTVMSQLATEHGAVNLGQGFPDDNGPDDVRAKAAEFLNDQPNQYPPMMGVAALREAVAKHAKRFYGLDVDALSEVMVTSGATEALAACLLGTINPGDEVVLIEPLYDSYLPIVRLAGGIAKLVRLAPPHWHLPRAELAAAFSPKTKAIVLNSPTNPIGKVFTHDELAFIAGLIARYDAVAICDEVYEHLTFDTHRHIPLMCLPGMRERCLRIGSAGKTFSITGWKVGYVTGAATLLQPAAKAHPISWRADCAISVSMCSTVKAPTSSPPISGSWVSTATMSPSAATSRLQRAWRRFR